MAEPRGQWSGQLGFILAATGSAIGLGNLWKFPYITLENNGFYGTYGGFSQDFEGEYLELGYGKTVTEAEIDLGISLIFANDDLIGEADESLIFTIGKSFDLN